MLLDGRLFRRLLHGTARRRIEFRRRGRGHFLRCEIFKIREIVLRSLCGRLLDRFSAFGAEPCALRQLCAAVDTKHKNLPFCMGIHGVHETGSWIPYTP